MKTPVKIVATCITKEGEEKDFELSVPQSIFFNGDTKFIPWIEKKTGCTYKEYDEI